MNNYLTTILLLLTVSSCSSNKPATQKDINRHIDNQISFYEREAQLMREIGADGNEKTYREQITLLEQQKEKQDDNSFIDFILDMIFSTK